MINKKHQRPRLKRSSGDPAPLLKPHCCMFDMSVETGKCCSGLLCCMFVSVLCVSVHVFHLDHYSFLLSCMSVCVCVFMGIYRSACLSPFMLESYCANSELPSRC